jgi:hypothetical protein
MVNRMRRTAAAIAAVTLNCIGACLPAPWTVDVKRHDGGHEELDASNRDGGVTSPSILCSPGSFVRRTTAQVDEAAACQPCGTGSYSTTTNAGSCTVWRDCPAGTYVSAAGTDMHDRECADCPAGTVSTTSNAASCTRHDDIKCPQNTKLCGDACELVSDPSFGCSASSCAPCQLDNATAQCDGARCQIARCDKTFADCDNRPTNGCEVPLEGDLQHCGSCAACSRKNDSAAYCEAGQCKHTCKEGWSDCNWPQPGSTDDGCEIELTTNAAHCGRCGHSCLGGVCSDGKCQPIAIASMQHGPGAIAVSASHIYWVNHGDDSGSGGAVMRLPVEGGPASPVASAETGATGIALSSTDVYWTSMVDGGAVRKVSQAGGSAVTFAASAGATTVAVSSTQVAWIEATSTQTNLKIAPLSGGAATTVAMAAEKSSAIRGQLAMDAARVYWVTPLGVYAAMLGGGSQDMLAPYPGNAYGLVVDKSNLYWSNLSDGGAVMKLALPATAPAVAMAEGRHGPQMLALDSDHLYWAENGSVNGDSTAIVTVSLAGGVATVLYHWPRVGSLDLPTGIVIDDKAIYWSMPKSGFVMKLAKP